MVWWWQQQQKDLPAFLTKRCWLELPLKGAPSRRSSLKTCHWRSLAPRHAVLEWMWENTLGSGRGAMFPGPSRKPERGWCWFGAAKFFGRPKRRSNRLFEGVLHHGAGLVQLTGVQVDAGGWIAVSVQIPGDCVVEDCQSFPKDGIVPQGGEHAAFFQQGRGVVGADAPSLS